MAVAAVSFRVQLIINRLKEDNVLDLIVLREILVKIADYDNAEGA